MSFTPFPLPHVLHGGAHFILFYRLFNPLTPGGTKRELNNFCYNSESKWLTQGLMSSRCGKGRAQSGKQGKKMIEVLVREGKG